MVSVPWAAGLLGTAREACSSYWIGRVLWMPTGVLSPTCRN